MILKWCVVIYNIELNLLLRLTITLRMYMLNTAITHNF